MKSYFCIRLIAVFLELASVSVRAQYGPYPDVRGATHNQGKLQLGVSNVGTLFDWTYKEPYYRTGGFDPFTGGWTKSGFYPANSDIFYGATSGQLWIGAQVNGDSLVSVGQDWYGPNDQAGDFWPQPFPGGAPQCLTINSSSPYYSPDAHSELDVIFEFTDTLARPDIEYRQIPPLGVKVTQRSMAWSGDPIDDFVLIHYTIENIGKNHLKRLFFGYLATGGAGDYDWQVAHPWDKAFSGFIGRYHAPEGCGYFDTLNISYGIDADGNQVDGHWYQKSPLGAGGKMLLGGTFDSTMINYNWVATLTGFEAWQPQKRSKPGDPANDWWLYSGVWGTGRELYYLMSRPEVDYDVYLASQNFFGEGWKSPDPICFEIARGALIQDLYSFGPMDLDPGEEGQFTVAIVAGENVHVNPTDWQDFINPDLPGIFWSKLDFSNFAANARWAQWVYDNPGYDTDGDGYRGEFRVCDGDTFWYKGDGVPDFRADVPPPAPLMKIIPSQGKLTIRWNGYPSESFVDPFTRQKDFEGYRVYMGLDKRETSLSLVAQFDYQNYNRFVMRQRANDTWDWQNKDMPFTLDSLRQWLNDSEFDPSLYPRPYPYKYQDTFYYFEAQSYNTGLDPRWVHKVYPDAVKPPDDTLQWTADMLTTEHGKPMPKYYEYEYVLDSLLPTVEYWCSVTAFDFGFAFGGIPSREASKYSNITNAYATPSAQNVSAEQLNVYVWPNPYRYDGMYQDQGFENHDQSLWYDRARRVNFGNLPNKCTISILSLDGDLIKEIHHNFAPDDPEAQHDSFDLISRAGLLVVSGIYYWVVESTGRTQMGKFVVIE